jgi:RES domain-containing protein
VADPLLLARIAALGATSFVGDAFRHLSPGIQPLSGHGALANGGRWNPPGSFPVLYLALTEDTAKAEFHRMADKLGQPAGDFLPRQLRQYDVNLTALLDLRDLSNRRALRLTNAVLRADPPSFCQAIGVAAHELGLEGILAPSATGNGTAMPVFFGRLRAGSWVRDAGYETWTAAP